MAHAARLQIHLLFVPTRATSLLQPLDTHVFGSLKRHLHAEQARVREADAAGRVPRGRWIQLAQQVVPAVLVARSWEHAFAENGLAGSAPPARRSIGDVCGAVFRVSPRALSDAKLTAVVARRVPGIRARVLSRRLLLMAEHGLPAKKRCPLRLARRRFHRRQRRRTARDSPGPSLRVCAPTSISRRRAQRRSADAQCVGCQNE